MSNAREQELVRQMIRMTAESNTRASGMVETFYDEDAEEVTINIDNDGIQLFESLETIGKAEDPIEIDASKYSEPTNGQHKVSLDCEIVSAEFPVKLKEFEDSFDGLFKVVLDSVAPTSQGVEVTYHLVPKE